ncbi:MAG: hypothetical protein JL50_11245 [Peptococcaceae bacterium BICA1-7]|nr:MAG: hypothetical protein JL50_11245 [Peptococcaceae bacterium BICA1-7]
MSSSSGVYIIAEAGVNHNGSLEIAMKLIDSAANAGADAIKFQTFKTAKLVSRLAPKANYQKETTNARETQFEMLKRLELSEEAHYKLSSHCRCQGIDFLSTPFDEESLDFLIEKLGVKTVKISSGDVTNAPLLLKISRTGLPVILSTGMATLAEIEQALGVLAFGYIHPLKNALSLSEFEAAFACWHGQKALKDKVTLLHCTTEYPAPIKDVNLRAMETMAWAFGLPVGYSDHTQGIAVPIGAASRGAVIIEKHFTLDRSMPGPDHRASLEPDGLKFMIQCIREIEVSLGTPQKVPAPSEFKNRMAVRKSLVATCSISEGEILTDDKIAVKRPGDGLSPFRYWDVIGKKANRDYREDEMLTI